MKITPLHIGELKISIPIIQGGMGVGVSRSSLAGAVSLAGGMGVISGVQIGFNEPDFETNCKVANLRALRNEIRKAKEISNNGIIGVNLMVAMNNYKENAEVCVEEGVDAIISGAGLPTELPSIVKGSKTKAIPIVSSAKAASVIIKMWEKRHAYIPDAVIVEGPEAGGHLGFHPEELLGEVHPDLHQIIKEVKEAVKPYEEKYNKKISVVGAGGIFSGKDIVDCIKAGADGVQMATRFVATNECDADIKYKQAYINSVKDEIKIIKSPVGMPGRAIENEFIEKVQQGNIPVKKCYSCLKTCDPKTTPYCISRALIEAVKGNISEGLIFTGSNAYKVDKILSVKELMEQLQKEIEAE